jgi:hypothetical protein
MRWRGSLLPDVYMLEGTVSIDDSQVDTLKSRTQHIGTI